MRQEATVEPQADLSLWSGAAFDAQLESTGIMFN